MRLLLDTHVLLWALIAPERVGAETRDAIENAGNEVLFSVVSIWEIAIKAALRRPDFAYRPEEIAREASVNGFVEFPVRSDAASLVADLPHYHRDPFDRLLVAQAIIAPAVLYTADPKLVAYSDLVKMVA